MNSFIFYGLQKPLRGFLDLWLDQDMHWMLQH